MNALKAYQRQKECTVWTRIDMVLGLLDGAIARLEQALPLVRAGNRPSAASLLLKVQSIMMGLASGINLEVGDPASPNLLRLYEHVNFMAGKGTAEQLEGCVRVLTSLREGFQGIRAEALQLERNGQLPRLVDIPSVAMTG